MKGITPKIRKFCYVEPFVCLDLMLYKSRRLYRIFELSINSDVLSDSTCSGGQNTAFHDRVEPKRNRTEVRLLTSLTPYRQTDFLCSTKPGGCTRFSR